MIIDKIIPEIGSFVPKAINHYGYPMQMVVAVEELSELQKEICKDIRRKGSRKNLTEEIADTLIMIEQICYAHAILPEEIGEVVRYKIDRQYDRMKKDSL